MGEQVHEFGPHGFDERVEEPLQAERDAVRYGDEGDDEAYIQSRSCAVREDLVID